MFNPVQEQPQMYMKLRALAEHVRALASATCIHHVLGVGTLVGLVLLTSGRGPIVADTLHAEGITLLTDRAAIVIVQPHPGHIFDLLDGSGATIGQVNRRTTTVVHVPAGHLSFHALLENGAELGHRIVGNVLPGKVYFATLSVRTGDVIFLTLTPRSLQQSPREDNLRNTGVKREPLKVPIAEQQRSDATAGLATVDDPVSKLGT